MDRNNLPAVTPEVAQVEYAIERLEARLAQMALYDESAYEKAMERTYQGMLDDRRRRLASLQENG